MNRKKIGIIVISVVIVGIAAFITVSLLVQKRIVENPMTKAVSPPLVDPSVLGALVKKSGSSAFVERVDNSIIPPTNSWISGLVLQKVPLAVYPMPLSFLASDTGFEIGLPTVQSQATIITGEHAPQITATIHSATGFMLTRYDKVSASLTYLAGSQTLGRLTLAEGSPYVFYRATATTSINLAGTGVVSKGANSTYLRYTRAGHDYVVVASAGARITTTGANAVIDAPKNSLVTFYALPGTGTDNLKQFAGNELTAVVVSDTNDNNGSTKTTFTYTTANSQSTVAVPMSYSHIVSSASSLETYDSIYGPMRAVKGNTVTTSVDTITPSNQLDVSHLTEAHKNEIIAHLPADIAKTTITANDSYYAGKQLARAATLLDITEQLGQTQASTQLKAILNEAFAKRLNGQFFYYDSTLKGIAAQTSAFGSEDFNDHHFHYGYFIYAASILGKYDTVFLKNYQKQIDLLVADIASYTSTSDFPLQRYYDPYAAHSWAAGLAPFSDGNNQESSSEAVNAWNGTALWAALTNNEQLEKSATWMLSNEAATAKIAWRSVNTSPSYLKNFTSPLTSLSFGGKRTYSTFFSDDANAKLGIQLIPMSPMMLQYATDGTSIDKVTNASIKNSNYNVALGDYVLMYMALSQPQQAEQLLSKQQDAFIDDGNSRSYMDAWVYSLTDRVK